VIFQSAFPQTVNGHEIAPICSMAVSSFYSVLIWKAETDKVRTMKTNNFLYIYSNVEVYIIL